MTAEHEKWTEIEHLPEWDEEYYDVYTAKKYGKWVMLKTLRKEYKEMPEMQAMLEKEFEIRYNLAHPHIVMINDLEEVPGLGLCIITDDVYGNSLRKLIDAGKFTEEHLKKLTNQLVDAISYVQTNHIVHHPIRPERIIFTENIGNLKLIDVGFDQQSHLSPAEASEDIYNYGLILKEALDALHTSHPDLRKVVKRCLSSNPAKRFSNTESLRMALERRKSSRFYMIIIGFLALMVILLAWLMSPYAPEPVI